MTRNCPELVQFYREHLAAIWPRLSRASDFNIRSVTETVTDSITRRLTEQPKPCVPRYPE